MPVSSLRFFVAGPPRSGTSTIHRALRHAGVFAVHGDDPVSTIPLAVLLQRAFLEGRDPAFYLARGIEAVADCHLTRSPKWDSQTAWPTFLPGFWTRFREGHPDCFIILNSRPTEEWIASVSRWKDLRARIVKSDLPFLPPSRGAYDEELGGWIEDYYTRTRMELKGHPNLIEFDINDPGAKGIIEARSGLKLPWWGRVNANPPPAPAPAPAKVLVPVRK